MTDVEKLMREAFDAVHVPDAVRARTLARIDELRAAEEGGTKEGAAEEGIAEEGIAGMKAGAAATDVDEARSADGCVQGGHRAGARERPGENDALRKEACAEAPEQDARLARACEERSCAQGGKDGGEMPVRPAGAKGPARHASRRHTGWRAVRAKVAAAACLLLAAVGVGGYALAATPTAYVGIDVNPSVELALNRFDRVIGADAYNDDGEALIAAASPEGMAYEDALAAIEAALEAQGYLSEGAVVEVSVVCDADERYAALEKTSMACLGAAGGGAHCMRASDEERDGARSCGMGMGKYRVWKALSDAGVDISQDEAASMSMRELRALADEAGVDAEWGCGGAGCASAASDGSERAGGGQGRGKGQGKGCGEGQGQGEEAGHGRFRYNGD